MADFASHGEPMGSNTRLPMTLKLRLPLRINLKQRSYNAIARIIHSLNIQAMWQCELVSACYSGSFEARSSRPAWIA